MSRPRTKRKVTIKDVAREADVSYSTVSRVVNNYKYVNPGTREKVIEAMQRLGYIANQQARSLVKGRSQVIGLLIHSFETSYVAEIVRGIDDAIAEAQYDLLLYTTHRRVERETTYVSNIVHGLADGLLVVLPRGVESYMDSLSKQNYPFVLIDYQASSDDVYAVGATNWQGAYDATNHLIELGHRRIGFITGDMFVGSSEDRLNGYRDALAASGLSYDPVLLYQGDFFKPKGFDAGRAFLMMEKPPTAIFASNDEMAFGAMEAALGLGYRVPEDVSIVGFDDIPQTLDSHPPLTTVRQPLREMGNTATKLLLDLIEETGELETPYIKLPTELIVRQSTASPDDSTLLNHSR
jgi:LacI family transcriptional regulator